MDKPLTILYEEFKKELTDLINNSNLPAFIIEIVLQNYLIEVKGISQKQYLIDKARYENLLFEEDDKKERNIE